MSIDRLLAFIVVGFTALLVGGIGGLLLGAAAERNELVALLARADLSDDCKRQINQAMRGVTQDDEGVSTPSQ